MSTYTIDDLEKAFHEYFKSKQTFLRIAKRYCEQNKVDEGQNAASVVEIERYEETE